MSVGHRTYILERLWNSNILVEWEEVGGGGGEEVREYESLQIERN